MKLRRFAEQPIGGKDIDAKLHEIYKVPSLDDQILLSDYDNESSDEEHLHHKPLSKQSNSCDNETNPGATSDSATSEEEEDHGNDSNISDNQSDGANTDSDNDVSYRAPPNFVVPTMMVRDKRASKPPERFGNWST